MIFHVGTFDGRRSVMLCSRLLFEKERPVLTEHASEVILSEATPCALIVNPRSPKPFGRCLYRHTACCICHQRLATTHYPPQGGEVNILNALIIVIRTTSMSASCR